MSLQIIYITKMYTSKQNLEIPAPINKHFCVCHFSLPIHQLTHTLRADILNGEVAMFKKKILKMMSFQLLHSFHNKSHTLPF